MVSQIMASRGMCHCSAVGVASFVWAKNRPAAVEDGEGEGDDVWGRKFNGKGRGHNEANHKRKNFLFSCILKNLALSVLNHPKT
jgi:hypothetical protein